MAADCIGKLLELVSPTTIASPVLVSAMARALSVPAPPSVDEYRSRLPVGSSLKRNASCPPPKLDCNARTSGKSDDEVEPTTLMLPAKSTATACASFALLPPRRVENSNVSPVGLYLATKMSC